ncbi:hypothetical protein [Simkania sp.]|uniref:hypothetical protein n=1 Tax=Simkania sp. TaxID=34094 RepID=UPI003B5219EE
MTNGLRNSFYTTTIDSATFFASSLLCKSFMPNSGLAVTSTINALSIQAVKYLGSPDQKTVQTIAGLVLGTCLINLLAKPIAARTTITISKSATLQLAGIHLVIKTTAYAAYQLAMTHYERWRYGTFNSFDDLKNLTPAQVGRSKAYFEKHPSIWDNYSFKVQAAFNLLLQENDLETLDFTNCSKNTTLNDRELAIFLASLDDEETLTEKQFQVLKAHETSANTHLYHKFFSEAGIEVSEEQQVHFAKTFYEQSLPPPYDTFLPILDFPTAKDTIDAVQALYYRSYYECYPAEFDALSLNNQLILKGIFDKCGPSRTLREPEIDELNSLSKETLEYYRNLYESDPSKWDAKGYQYQLAFDEALEALNMAPLTIPKTPMPTWQKVGLAVAGCFLLVGAVYAVAYLKSPSAQMPPLKTQEDPPTTSPSPTVTETLQHASPPPAATENAEVSQPITSTQNTIATETLQHTPPPPAAIENVEVLQTITSTQNTIATETKPLKLPVCALNDPSRFLNTSFTTQKTPTLSQPFKLGSTDTTHTPEIINPCVYSPPPVVHEEDKNRALTLYVDPLARYRRTPQPSSKPLPHESSVSLTATQEIPKAESASLSQWFPIPIIGALDGKKLLKLSPSSPCTLSR